MLWDQRVVGSNPISPTIFPTVSDTSNADHAERKRNGRKRATAIGRNDTGIITDAPRTLRQQIADRKKNGAPDIEIVRTKGRCPRKPTKLVYFIKSSSGPIKIGIALDPIKRLNSLQCGHYAELSIVAVRKGGAKRERELHTRFAEHRLLGEWFSPAPEILDEIERLKSGYATILAALSQAGGAGE